MTVKVSLWEEAAPLEEKVISGQGRDKILLMDISGMLLEQSPTRWLGLGGPVSLPSRVKEELKKASADKRIKALVLRVHSPGGTVNAADLIYHELVRFKEERQVKIIAWVMGLAASGGYYVAQAADTIIAQPTSIIGSIGVVALKFNVKGLMDKIGVDTELVKSGQLKDLWSPFRPASPEEARLMQGIIDDFHRRFVGLVVKHRQLSRAEVLKCADGRIFTASQALAHRLLDSIGYLDEALELAKDQAGLKEARVVRYHRPETYVNNIYSLMPGGPPRFGYPRGQLETRSAVPVPEFFYLWGLEPGVP
ncbi:MAG: signal peptide peptidase SppA [Desulfobacca sp.]|nr:signal peptide peptidase SppA [Desulfobacca sp.]